MKLKQFSVAAAVLLLVGCALRPSPEDLASADYGQYPDGYEEVITSYMTQRLKDPYSAQYQFLNTPQKGWYGVGSVRYGYVVCVLINGKNSFGGYTGAQLHYFMLRGGVVVDASHGSDEYSNAVTQGKCKPFI